jgi:hypothetical protein
MAERMRTFVVPEGLDTCNVSDTRTSNLTTFAFLELPSLTCIICQLRPYVAKTAKITGNNGQWPMAHSKPDPGSKRGGIYGPNGFDGEYYLQLSEFLAEKRGNAE